MRYPEAGGLPELREAIAGHLRMNRGIAWAAEEVFVFSGAQDAFTRIGRADRSIPAIRSGSKSRRTSAPATRWSPPAARLGHRSRSTTKASTSPPAGRRRPTSGSPS